MKKKIYVCMDIYNDYLPVCGFASFDREEAAAYASLHQIYMGETEIELNEEVIKNGGVGDD